MILLLYSFSANFSDRFENLLSVTVHRNESFAHMAVNQIFCALLPCFSDRARATGAPSAAVFCGTARFPTFLICDR